MLDPRAALTLAARILRDHPDIGVQAVGDMLADRVGPDGDPGLQLGVAVAIRDRLLRRFAAREFSEMPAIAHQARAIAVLYGRFRAAGWLLNRAKAANPYPADSRHACFWALSRLLDRDLSERQLRRVLAVEPARTFGEDGVT